MTWARSEDDEEQVEGECSQIDEGDIPKQEVLKIPTWVQMKLTKQAKSEDPHVKEDPHLGYLMKH